MVPLKKSYSLGDIAGYYEAVKSFEDGKDDDAVLKATKEQLSFDLNLLCEITGISKERVKNALWRLVSTGRIDKRFENIKDKMDGYEPGDYVKIIDSKYNKYAKDLYYSDNVFKIFSIDNGQIRLSDIENNVNLMDIEAIPIDGIHDRAIFYDPPISASYVNHGESVPFTKNAMDEYYMDGLGQTSEDSNKNTYKKMVLEENCQFVHEVQHLLRRISKNDHLKLNKTIKAS